MWEMSNVERDKCGNMIDDFSNNEFIGITLG
jgi:hypothetical protein